MTVSVEVNSTWVRLVRSPLYYIVAAFTGVSVSFAPLFLYWSGKGWFFHQHERVIVPVCFAVIFLVPFFYMRLGSMVIRELRKKSG
jgi:hypothetical protein